MINFKYIIIALAILATSSSYTQQIVMNSQYMFNDFAINPAVAGTKNYAPITIDLRRQWTGIREAPAAQHISYHGFVHKQIGAGGYVFNDVAGPIRRSGAMAAISTQIATTKRTRMSFGLAGSFSQFMIDRDRVFTEEPDDITVSKFTTNELIPDISAGIHWYGPNHHIGISGHNLLRSKLDLFSVSLPVTSTLDRAFYLNGAYLFEFGRSPISVEPSAILRYMFNSPLQFDANVRLIYEHRMWLGVSYRYADAMAILVGFEKGWFGIGYSYDINTSALRNYNSGSHELVLIFKTNKGANKQGPWSGRNRVYDCPSFN